MCTADITINSLSLQKIVRDSIFESEQICDYCLCCFNQNKSVITACVVTLLVLTFFLHSMYGLYIISPDLGSTY